VTRDRFVRRTSALMRGVGVAAAPWTNTRMPLWIDATAASALTARSSSRNCQPRDVLLPRGGNERCLHALPLAQVDDFRRLADLEHVQRIRVIVDIGDRLAGDL